jgi:hypothetical protein
MSLHSQKPRQLAFAAELGRYAANSRDLRIADAGIAHPMWVHEGEGRAETVKERWLG